MDSGDAADTALRAASRAWHLPQGTPGDDGAYQKWSVPGGYTVRGDTLGVPVVEFVVWVAASAGSGVLGNAAYDAMKALIGRVQPGPAPVLGRGDVEFLARLAVRVALLHNGLDDSGPIEVTEAAWAPDGGRWRIEARHGIHGFRFTLPDRLPQDVLISGASGPSVT